MKRVIPSFVMIGLLALSGAASADAPFKDAAAARADVKKTFGFVPDFINRLPGVALPSAWEEMKSLEMNPDTQLSAKAKELIGLAVSSQIPCEYCVFFHTEFAKLNGATAEEIGDAVAMAGQTRNFSTFLNGVLPDEAKYQAEVARWVIHLKEAMRGMVAPKTIAVIDTASALKDVEHTFGNVPEFIGRFPPASLPAFWRSFKDVEMGKTSLDDKTKSLIGLAVAAQIPCRYCIVADTQFAKLKGTSELEMAEAIAMAGHVRNWSTLINGMQVDKGVFKKDIARIVRAFKKSSQNTAPATKSTAMKGGAEK